MARLSRCLWTLTLLLVPAATAAQPFPGTSIVPPFLRVVTPREGGADPTAVYSVTVNDFFGAPIPGETVTLDFTGCPHVDPASEQSFPGMSVDACAPTVLSAVTNGLGIANFLVQGSVISRGAAGTGAGCVLVSAGAPPIPLGTASPAAYDQDGVNGLTANDLSLWFCDFLPGPPINVRSDFNGDGMLTPVDLIDWFNQYLDANGTSRTPERCDGGAEAIAENPVAAPRLRLTWNNCAANGGSQTRTFACNTNLGSETLEGSFIAPVGVDAMTGFEAEVAIMGDLGEVLAPWWRVGAGGCRANAMTLMVDYDDPVGSCPGVAEGLGLTWIGIQRTDYPVPATSERSLVRIVGTFNPPGLALTPGQEYSIFRLRVNHTRTVGGACAGCAENVAFLFRRLKLTQPATVAGGCLSPPAQGPVIQVFTGDFVIPANTSTDEWIAFWQGVPTDFPTVLGAPPATAAATAGITLWTQNPSRGPTAVQLSVPRPMRCSLAVYDVSGRRRRALVEEALPAGARALTWDGRDDDGRPLASGYYVLRMVTEDGALSRSLIRLR